MSKPELAMWASDEGTGRAYKHPFLLGPDEKPLKVPSVTTILKLVDKSGISQWAADQTVQWAIDNASLLMSRSDEDIVKWGRWRWKDARDERAEVGTGIHNYIEAEHTGSWNYPVLDDEQQDILAQWRLLNERYLITPHRSEFTVWSHNYEYAGTADGLWDIVDTETGEAWENLLIDLKTSKNTWPEHWMQLAALRNADVIMEKAADGTWSEVEDWTSSGTAIIHLRADMHEVLIETDPILEAVRFNKFLQYRSLWELTKAEEDLLKTRAEEAAFKGF